MSVYTMELSEIERACGVTLEAVAEHLPRVYVFGCDSVAVPAGLSPALAGAVARCALAGPVEFVTINRSTGFPVYRRTF